MPTHPSFNRRQLLTASAMLAAAAPTMSAQQAVGASAAPDLSGKTILITGTSSGFGRLGAEYYARLGARVFASMRNLPRVEAAELEVLAVNDTLAIEVVEIDVTSDESVASGVAHVLDQCDGKLDVLVNNAGIATSGPVEVQDMDATRLLFETNVFGPHRMSRAVLPAMRAHGRGQIFNVTSQLGRVIIPGFGLYSSTKFALEAMSEQMAYELVPHGIDITIVEPGGYPTKIWENQAKLSGPLKERTEEERLAAYPSMTASMGSSQGGGGSTDPMDVPRAIAEIIAMPAGTRPLRRPVHPAYRPQEGINEASAAAQLAMLGNSPAGPLVKSVLGR